MFMYIYLEYLYLIKMFIQLFIYKLDRFLKLEKFFDKNLFAQKIYIILNQMIYIYMKYFNNNNNNNKVFKFIILNCMLNIMEITFSYK